MLPFFVIQLIACDLDVAHGQGKLRLALFFTSDQVQAYQKFKPGFDWSKLTTTVKSVTGPEIDRVLGRKAGFPFDMTVTITAIEKVPSSTAGKWLEYTGATGKAGDGTGFLEFIKYAKNQNANFDLAALVFSESEMKKWQHSPGYAPIGAACSPTAPALFVFGQMMNNGEPVWSWLLAHEIGHQLGAEEGPGGKTDPCYDIMSGTPNGIPKNKMWTTCSYKAIVDTALKGKLKCLGLYE